MNVGVIFGGESCEHDISIVTGEQLIDNLNEYLYNIIPIYIDKNGVWYTGDDLLDIDNIRNNKCKLQQCALIPNEKFLYVKRGKKFIKMVQLDVVFVCMHGLRGEDGVVAGILEMSKIPYSSSSICASSVCMDKCVFKDYVKTLGCTVVDSLQVDYDVYSQNKIIVIDEISAMGLPVIIKPSRQGSSIGIEVCKSSADLEEKLNNAFKYDKKLLIEKFVNIKKEVNIAILYNKGEYLFSSTEEPLTNDEILTFDDKYRKNSGGFETIKRKIPAVLDDNVESLIKDMALKVYKGLEMFGIVRFDFIIDNNDKLFLNEVNTIPGSMANYLFDKKLYGYEKLIEIVISNSLLRFKKSNEILKSFDTDVLKTDFDGFKK